MKIKTSELIGPALDWAVAKCEGKVEAGVYGMPEVVEGELHLRYCDTVLSNRFAPAFCWAQGGLIVDNNPRIVPTYDERFDSWFAYKQSPALYGKQSFLVSAMRAYVASKLGDTVDIPDELFKGNKC